MSTAITVKIEQSSLTQSTVHSKSAQMTTG